MKRLQKAKLPLSLLFAALAMVCVAALAPSQANATLYTLTDGSSTVKIESTGANAGVNDWIVNGADYLTKEWFYYTGTDGKVYSIDNLGAPVAETSGTDTLKLTYSSGGLTVSVKFILTGGGLTLSDLDEPIKVINSTGSTVNFFEYTNIDLSNNSWDSGGLTNANTVLQTSGPIKVSETVTTPGSANHEVGDYSTVLGHVLLKSLTGLPAVGDSTGPGDLAWALQWDILKDSTLIISKDKRLEVPIPASALLLGTGLLGLVGQRYRSRRKS